MVSSYFKFAVILVAAALVGSAIVVPVSNPPAEDMAEERLQSRATSSWMHIVEDARHGWDGLIELRDLYSPDGIDLTVTYNTHTKEASDHLNLSLLDASIWMYLITGDSKYLDQARQVADDLGEYVLNEKGIVRGFSRSAGASNFAPTTNREALIDLSKLALLDSDYRPMVSKLADAMIRYEIDPETNLFYAQIFPNGTAAKKEMYLPYDGSLGIEALMKAYEATSNEDYLAQAKETITSFWDTRNKTTNMLPSWVYSDTKQVKEDYMQLYGAGVFLKLLLHYHYLTSNNENDGTVYSIIEDYTEAVTTYIWDGTRWNYRTNSDGNVSGRLGMVAEANFPKLDDALFLVYDLERSTFQEAYLKAKLDYDSTFQSDLILTNNLVKHAVYDDGSDFSNHQSVIWHAFPAIQNPAMRLYRDTGDELYLQKMQSYYNAIIEYHKRDHGYIGATNPHRLDDDPYSHYLEDSAAGFIANKIFSTVRPSSSVEIVWTKVGEATNLQEPLIVIYVDTGWFNMVSFDLAKSQVTLRMVTGEGTISFADEIREATMDGQAYADFEGSALKTAAGTHSYTASLAL